MLYTNKEANNRIAELRKKLSQFAHVQIIPDMKENTLNRILVIDYIDRKPTEEEINQALKAFEPEDPSIKLKRDISKIPFEPVIIKHIFKDSTNKEGLVFCRINKNHEPFVIWRFFLNTLGNYELYSGTYHRKLIDAEEDFRERAQS